MHHVAIMRPSWQLIPKILAGEKTVESRWYLARRAPWDGIAAGDAVFFKDSGRPVTARARVAKVLQFEIKGLADARAIVREHGRAIRIVEPDPNEVGSPPPLLRADFPGRPEARRAVRRR